MSKSESSDRQGLIRFLGSAKSYPHDPERVVHLQTHASDVFVAPPYVYKVKKPVDFGFLDFTTLEKRKYFCEREVELNRRLCSGTYLGVEEIKLGPGGLSFGGDGETAEYAVRMRKLPGERFLKNLLREGKCSGEDFKRLARKLTGFYSGQTPGEEVTSNGAPEKVRSIIDDNERAVESFIGKTISRVSWEAVHFFNERFFTEKAALFTSRRDGGFIKDCHGDLHMEHINIGPDDICIYDCIEFNDRFRYIDVASDVAFLAMDLDFNGYFGRAREFVADMADALGESGDNVLDFYKCYRAYVRGKVGGLTSVGEGVPEDEREEAGETARRYFGLALRYALFGSSPTVIVTFGVIGSGKSTLAEMLARELSCPVVSSDRVRKEITGTGATERRREGYEGGIYSPETTARTYEEIISRGLGALETRNTVVLDASFSKRRWRDMVFEKSAEGGFGALFVETAAPEEVLRERLGRREKEGSSVSDAGPEMLERFTADFERPDELGAGKLFTADTDREEEEVLLRLFKEIITKRF
ncbi:MAG: AAA family ATPase [Candidatus Dadabacteria bacterium]|nr:AAA family ATPase [Candidatus Dadabacteria bacterium]